MKWVGVECQMCTSPARWRFVKANGAVVDLCGRHDARWRVFLVVKGAIRGAL
jgi:hypothetical protein